MIMIDDATFNGLCALLFIFLGTRLFKNDRPARFMVWLVGKFDRTAPQEVEPIEDVFARLQESKGRQRTLEHQDWEHEFRLLNKGKHWDYKPKIGPPPVRKPLRKIIDPDGEIIEINSWQDILDEEAICNPCARHQHNRCVVLDDTTDDICFCDCTEDEY